MLRKLFDYYQNNRQNNYNFEKVINELEIQSAPDLFNPNEQDEQTGDTVLHMVVKNYWLSNLDKRLLVKLFELGANPSLLNKKKQDVVDVILAHSVAKENFSLYFSLIQEHYPDTALIFKMLHNYPDKNFPNLYLNTLSLDDLPAVLTFIKKKLESVKEYINKLMHQAANEHDWAARHTYEEISAYKTFEECLETQKNNVEAYIPFAKKYSEFTNTLFGYLKHTDTRSLILRAMLSGGSLLFFFEKTNKDKEFINHLTKKHKTTYLTFWEEYLITHKRLKELHASIDAFTPEEDKQLSAIYESLFVTHPEYKLLKEAEISFQGHFAQSFGKNLIEFHMEERKAAFIKNNHTRTAYQALQNEFKQCLQKNPSSFFGAHNVFARHKIEVNTQNHIDQKKLSMN